jgi:hypothetical protein
MGFILSKRDEKLISECDPKDKFSRFRIIEGAITTQRVGIKHHNDIFSKYCKLKPEQVENARKLLAVYDFLYAGLRLYLHNGNVQFHTILKQWEQALEDEKNNNVKTCIKCNCTIGISLFSTDSARPDGKRNDCNFCRKEVKDAWERRRKEETKSKTVTKKKPKKEKKKAEPKPKKEKQRKRFLVKETTQMLEDALTTKVVTTLDKQCDILRLQIFSFVDNIKDTHITDWESVSKKTKSDLNNALTEAIRELSRFKKIIKGEIKDGESETEG